MAETRTVRCDKCDTVVLEGLTRLTVESGVMRDRDGMTVVDLCQDCGEQLRSFVRTAQAAARSA
jgi:RNase P subunit RPR2